MSKLLLAKVQTSQAACYIGSRSTGKVGNEIYATAVYTMILAMPYHYIPLYQR